MWSKPDTRKKLLEGLEEKDYGQEQLLELSRVIKVENCDLYDVLAYIAFASDTMSREERVGGHKGRIFEHYDDDKQQRFLSFVLDHYITQGVRELDQEKLPNLLELKYQSLGDAQVELGSVAEIRKMFVSFQEHLYSSD